MSKWKYIGINSDGWAYAYNHKPIWRKYTNYTQEWRRSNGKVYSLTWIIELNLFITGEQFKPCQLWKIVGDGFELIEEKE